MTRPTVRIGLMSDLHNEIEAGSSNRLFRTAPRDGDTQLASVQRGYVGREPGAEKFVSAIIDL
jgi:hypothetical protein